MRKKREKINNQILANKFKQQLQMPFVFVESMTAITKNENIDSIEIEFEIIDSLSMEWQNQRNS